MKSVFTSSLKPNLNGFVIFIFLLTIFGIILFLFPGASITYIFDPASDAATEPVISSNYIGVLSLFVLLALTLWPLSMYIGGKLPINQKSTILPVINVTALLALLVPIEWYCARLAFHTLGEINSVLCFMAIGLNLLFLLISLRLPKTATAFVFLLAVAIIPYQLYLSQRLMNLQEEAARIVAYAYEQKLATGQYPSDLSGYIFQNPTIKRYIQNYSTDNNGDTFHVTYRVGTVNTSHWYNPNDGWGYYPD